MLCDRCNSPFQSPYGPVIGRPPVPPLDDARLKELLAQPGQIVAMPASLMTGDQFVIWLRGYIASCSVDTLTKGDWKVIAAKLDTLGGPK